MLPRIVLSLTLLALPPAVAQAPNPTPGIAIGQHIPSLAANDQSGHPQTFESLRGPKGLLILFSRSADWCPYCKMHLLQLQEAKAEFEAKGIHIASLTYDSEAILQGFALRRGITYPMLSDPDSKIIKSFGILNTEAKGFSAGIPYPGIYLISPSGVIEKRFFEDKFTDRYTPNNIYAELFGGVPTAPTAPAITAAHLGLQLSQSDATVGAGSRIKLFAAMTPGAHAHLYAPGAEKNGYKVVSLTLDPSTDYRAEPTVYPVSTLMSFPALKEKDPVYSSKTVLTRDVVLSATKDFSSTIGTGRTVHIAGTLLYQACDDHQCFTPVQQPVQWDLKVLPYDTVRSPEDIRHK
jgi:peroxiredoxin